MYGNRNAFDGKLDSPYYIFRLHTANGRTMSLPVLCTTGMDLACLLDTDTLLQTMMDATGQWTAREKTQNHQQSYVETAHAIQGQS